MIIQNEYCDGGSLHQKLRDGPLPEPELLLLLAHIAKGLSYVSLVSSFNNSDLCGTLCYVMYVYLQLHPLAPAGAHGREAGEHIHLQR